MITIGLPVHDEEHTIGPLLWRIRELLTGQGRDFRVLVLDDASGDRTAAALEPYGQVLNLTVLRNERRQGYAPSLERLCREAVARSDYTRRDALVTLQADFSDAPEVIPDMVRSFEGGADLVTTAPEEESEPPRPRKAVRWGARLVARGLPRPPGVADPFGSFRLYRLFTLERAMADLGEDRERLLVHEGWAANAELLIRVWPHVRRAEEVRSTPDYGRRYRESRFRPWSEAWELRRAARDRRLRAYGSRIEEGA